jgi:hypothetical protein
VFGEDERMRLWVSRASDEAASRTAVRAVGKLKLNGPGGSGRVKQVIIVERPDRLRLESLNFLGQTQSLLVTDGTSYAFYSNGEIERGGVSPDVLREYMGLDVAPFEAVALLVAAPELPSGRPRAVFGSGTSRIAEYDASRVHFAASGQITGLDSFDSSGALRFTARYDAWRDVPGGRYPSSLIFYFPRSDLRAELELDRVELNPSLDSTLFSLPAEGRE